MQEMIKFGKYKGQPVEVLATDPQYCDWLAGQDWFRNKYATVYNIIVNNFVKPEDTPEHNKLQAMFLDDEVAEKVLCFARPIQEAIYEDECIIRVAKNLLLKTGYCYTTTQAYEKIIKEAEERIGRYANTDTIIYEDLETTFEVCGWDVCVSGKRTSYCLSSDSRTAEVYGYSETDSVYVEIKPSIGDDFPSVLRQMKQNANLVSKHGRPGRFILIYDKFTAQGVDEQSLRKMFVSSGFCVTSFNELLKNAEE